MAKLDTYELPPLGRMTSLQLLLWISAGILLQLTIYLGVGFWRHWMSYLALRSKVAELDIEVSPIDLGEVPESTAPAWAGWRSFKVERKVFENADQSVCSFELVAQDGKALPPFLPGQFLTFSLDIVSATGNSESVVRCYSLSDAPHPSHYRVSIKREPASGGFAPGRSSNFFHDQVTQGSLLQVRAPAGHFYIERSTDPVVLIGGGVGITPMLSMLNWCLVEQPGREIWLFYGVRNSSECVMTAQLEALAGANPNFHLHLCLSQPAAQDLPSQAHRLHGRVDVGLLRRILPLKPHHFYICGPTPMLQSLVPALEDWGVPDAHIHFEAFGPASIPRKKSATKANASLQPIASTDSPVTVTFAKSGKQLVWQGADGSLLDFAESHGISVACGCRAGGCGSCQTSITSGEVGYRQAPDFDPEPGTCLLCVCTPKTSVTLEA
jgi:ferredoxin-NADP reductase